MGENQKTERVSPNVIIILVDDLGVADVSYSARRINEYGRKDSTFTPAIETPELDALAEDSSSGIQLINSFTHTLCGPSRSALLTGRLAHNLGNPFAMVQGGSLDPKYKTIGHEFQLRNYSTHFVGKWGVDYPRPSAEVLAAPISYKAFNGRSPGMGPTERGFDTFYGLYSSGHNHYTKEVIFKGAVDWHKHNKTHKLDYPDVDHHPTEYSTDLFTKEAIEVIKSWSPDKPGFLHLSYTAPHDPLQAPEEDMNSNSCRKMKNWRRKTFCGMVTAVDRGIGDIKRALRASPDLLDNTIILFSTDNGGAPPVGGFNYPYRGQKASLYEGGFRTPAFLYIPSSLSSNGSNNNHYSNTMHIADFGLTILGIVDRISGNSDMVGQYAALGNDLDGVDHTEYLLPSLVGKTLSEVATMAQPRNSTVLEHHAFMEHAAYLEGEWKLILGSAGQADRFSEPKGYWYDQNGRPRYVVEEVAANFIDLGLGTNWFAYSWAMRFMLDRAIELIHGQKSPYARQMSRNRTQRLINNVRENPFNGTINRTKDTLPPLDFGVNYDPTEIQLYNLKEDPYEYHNVAYENQELVKEMYDNLILQVKDDPGHHFAVQKFFLQNPMRNMTIFVGSTLLLFISLGSFLLYYTCCRKKKTYKQKKE